MSEEKAVSGASAESGEHSWEKRLAGETAQAFRAFSMYRSMGFKRSIKGCLAMHEIDPGKYGSWSRWSRLYGWNDRAAEFDEFCAKEAERAVIAEHAERRRRVMEMLDKVDSLVGKRLDSLRADDLDAYGTMDLLERSAKLDGYIAGSDGEKKTDGSGQLEINFVDGFDGL